MRSAESVENSALLRIAFSGLEEARYDALTLQCGDKLAHIPKRWMYTPSEPQGLDLKPIYLKALNLYYVTAPSSSSPTTTRGHHKTRYLTSSRATSRKLTTSPL